METGSRPIPLELYIHIPFCIRKCAYCDFLSFPAGEEERSLYVEQLAREIEEAGAAFGEYVAETVFIGGGTPSVLEGAQIGRIMDAVRESFHLSEEAEITMEVNPGTASPEKLRSWRRSGINRLSLGLQSAQNRELRYLGRIHTAEDFLESFHAAREAGFENINVDLMSALPGQTEEAWEDTLKKVLSLMPEHISAYSLIIEEGTPFYEKYGTEGMERKGKARARADLPPLPDENTERSMYEATERILSEAGYHRYEISNYARPGFECRHNRGYWTGTEYLGLGLGASSYIIRNREADLGGCPDEAGLLALSGAERFLNTLDMGKYLAYSREDFRAGRHTEGRDRLTWKDRMEEFMFLGLRLTEGVAEQEFERRFGCPIRQVYGKALEECVREGLMEYVHDPACSGSVSPDGLVQTQGKEALDSRWRLTGRGVDVSNWVLAKFLIDEKA